jgi:alcohol dehydrogenase, propanol-preferring
MVLSAPGPIESSPLRFDEVEDPSPGPREVLVRVERCGVCRTDLHVAEGDLPPLGPTVIPGHEAVGTVERLGGEVRELRIGQRVGLPWLGSTCGRCAFCLGGRENLCLEKRLTGYGAPGGYAELAVGDARFVHPLPAGGPAALAPWLCAGLIGYRALKLARPAPGGRIGFFGFGGSAHLTLQLARRLGFEAVAFSRSAEHLALARRLGASETVLTGPEGPPEGLRPLDGAIVFAPVGSSVLSALRVLSRGGRLAIAAIHLTPIPALDYDRLLVGERSIQSVEANTREDAREFLALAERLGLESSVEVRPLRAANEALRDLKEGKVQGAVVLDCAHP